MPSPVGHALAAAALAWTVEAVWRSPVRVSARWSLALACAALAVCPDLDLLYPPIHRTITHSLVAAALAGVMAWLLVRRTTRDAWRVAVVCALAYGSHMLLDWMGGDTKLPAGIQLLWPFSDHWFISSWGVFRATTLGGFF